MAERGAAALPSAFADLEPWAARWAVTGRTERAQLRASSSTDEMRAFYQTVLPRLGDALAYLHQYPADEMPASARRLLHLILALAEVSTFVEFYDGENHVPNAFAEDRLVAIHKD